MKKTFFFSDIWAIHTTMKKVYFQAQEVVFEYDISSEKVLPIYPAEGSSFHTSFLVEDVLHLRSRGVGLVKYENQSLNKLENTEVFKNLGVFGLYKLADDSLFIITKDSGIWKWKDGSVRQLNELNPVPLEELGVFGSTSLSDGNFALNTFTKGVQIINSKGELIKKNRPK